MNSSESSPRTPWYKEGHFWLAVAIVLGFSALTASVFSKAKDFEQAFRLWDSLAVIFSALVGGLLGFTVNYARATQAESKATKEEAVATAAMADAGRSQQREAALRPVVERVIRLAERRKAESDSAIVLDGGRQLTAALLSGGMSVVDGRDLDGMTIRVASADPELLLVADQAKNVLHDVDAMRKPAGTPL